MRCPWGWLPILLLLVRVRVGLRLQQSLCRRCGGKGVQQHLAWNCALYSGKVEDIWRVQYRPVNKKASLKKADSIYAHMPFCNLTRYSNAKTDGLCHPVEDEGEEEEEGVENWICL